MSGYELRIPEHIVLGGSVMIERMAMFSASHQQSLSVYDHHIGKSGQHWFVATGNDRGGKCYVWDPRDRDSRGFAGRTLTFRLSDGTTMVVKGPWHSNSDALFADTGVDVRNEHVTWGCIGLNRVYRRNNAGDSIGYITEVVYFDPTPMVGPFNRVDDYAIYLQKTTRAHLYVFSMSVGGSHHGPVGKADPTLRHCKSIEEYLDLAISQPTFAQTMAEFYEAQNIRCVPVTEWQRGK